VAGLNGIAVSLHPGVVRTELGRYLAWKVFVVKTILRPITFWMIKSPWEGAQTTLYLSLEDASKIAKGQYYADCEVAPTTPFCSDMQNAELLWNVTERELGI
jgi:retinol dehydrogenase-13